MSKKRERVGVNVTLPRELHTLVKLRAVQEGAKLEEIIAAACVLYVQTAHKGAA